MTTRIESANGALIKPAAAVIEVIGPARAAQLLARNEGNRHPRPDFVDRYARVMAEGGWRFNPADAIVLDTSGRIINGQHRLLAVIKSKTEQTFAVFDGAEPDLFAVIDDGNKRRASDWAHLMGVPQAKLYASAVYWIIREDAAWKTAQAGGSYRLHVKGATENTLFIAYAQRHPNLRDSLSIPYRFQPRGLLTSSVAVWLHYRFSLIDHEDADLYLERIARGEGRSSGHPDFAVRRWLLQQALSSRKPRSEHVAAIVIKGWNKFRSGQPSVTAHWDASKEQFPRVDGEFRESMPANAGEELAGETAGVA